MGKRNMSKWWVALSTAAGASLVMVGFSQLPGSARAEAPAATTRAETRPSTASAEANEQRFIRLYDDGRGHRSMQTSTVRFVNDAGVVVDLVAAVHIADKTYYHELDSNFDGYDKVLFEGVSADPKHPSNGMAMGMITILQKGMTTVLELQFQKDGINYKRENFLHADMTENEFRTRQEAKGESLLGGVAQNRSHEMEMAGTDFAITMMDSMGKPDRPLRMKRAMAKVLASMETGSPETDSVIIYERNQVCLKVLKQAIADGHKNLAIFYGGGHYPNMTTLLERDFGFHQVGPPVWHIAWNLSDATTPSTAPATRTPAK